MRVRAYDSQSRFLDSRRTSFVSARACDSRTVPSRGPVSLDAFAHFALRVGPVGTMAGDAVPGFDLRQQGEARQWAKE
jgi:hypothetical protein